MRALERENVQVVHRAGHCHVQQVAHDALCRALLVLTARRQCRQVEQDNGKVQALARVQRGQADGCRLLEGELLVADIRVAVARMPQRVPDRREVGLRRREDSEILRIVAE